MTIIDQIKFMSDIMNKSIKIGSVVLIMLFSLIGNYAYTFYEDVNDYVILNINKVNQDPDPAIAGDVITSYSIHYTKLYET